MAQTPPKPIPILVIDPDPAPARLIQRVATDHLGDAARVTHAPDPPAAQPLLDRPEPFVALLEYHFPKHTALDLLETLQQNQHPVATAVLTANGNAYIAAEVTRAGADAYLAKRDLSPAVLRSTLDQLLDLARLRAAQHAVHQHTRRALSSLTPRENQVLQHIIAGLTTRQIADRLHRSEKTIKIHRANLMRKMNANTAGHLVRLALDARHNIDPQ
ncbi:MAG: LuxR C-terminal-related transcriptional regulator [Planctomycetota bacterium]